MIKKVVNEKKIKNKKVKTCQLVQFTKPKNDKEREEYAKMYTPFVYKIALQNKDTSPLAYEDILGFGFEGLADAMNTYDPSKGQSFMQYAGYRIYYYIMNGSYEEGHVVKFSAYQQEQAKKQGLPTFIAKSIVTTQDGSGDLHWNIPEPIEEPYKPNLEHILDNLKSFVKTHFNERDADIFFQTFGLGKQEDVPRVQIAKQYGVSSAAITYINQRILKAIREDDTLRDDLEDLL